MEIEIKIPKICGTTLIRDSNQLQKLLNNKKNKSSYNYSQIICKEVLTTYG